VCFSLFFIALIMQPFAVHTDLNAMVF